MSKPTSHTDQCECVVCRPDIQNFATAATRSPSYKVKPRTKFTEAIEDAERWERMDLWAGLALMGSVACPGSWLPDRPDDLARHAWNCAEALEAERDRRRGAR